MVLVRLAGAPGQGKTTIAIVATVIIGGRWPDGSRCEAGNVLIWNGEDDYTDTLLPQPDRCRRRP